MVNECWVIPPEANAEFVCQMEEILELYTLPWDSEYPQVYLDESSKQLISEVKQPIPAEPGQVERYDHEYKREGALHNNEMILPNSAFKTQIGGCAPNALMLQICNA